MIRPHIKALGMLYKLAGHACRDRYRDTWDAATEYRAGDMVTHRGGLWRLRDAVGGAVVSGCEPGPDAAWQLVVRRGAKGNEGKRGKDASEDPALASVLNKFQGEINELTRGVEHLEAMDGITNELLDNLAAGQRGLAGKIDDMNQRTVALEAMAHVPQAVMTAQWGEKTEKRLHALEQLAALESN